MRGPSRSRSSRSTSAVWSRRSSRRRLPEAALDLPGRAARGRDGPAPARADPRQPARQRPRARGRLAGRGDARGGPRRDRRWSVADRGPGVPPDRLERIFERFYKADPSRHGGSSGLGLAIAAEHAALLGGTLSATNRPDGGLRIELRLPVTGSLPRSDGIGDQRRRCWDSELIRSGDPAMKRLSSILVVGDARRDGRRVRRLDRRPWVRPDGRADPVRRTGRPGPDAGTQRPGEPVRGAVRDPGRDPVEPTVGRAGWQRRADPGPGRDHDRARVLRPRRRTRQRRVSSRSCARCPRPPPSHGRR